MLKSEILKVLKKQIGGAVKKPIHVKLDDPIYDDRLNVNPTYLAVDDKENIDEEILPNVYKNRLNKKKQLKTVPKYPNSYTPKIFFGLGLSDSDKKSKKKLLKQLQKNEDDFNKKINLTSNYTDEEYEKEFKKWSDKKLKLEKKLDDLEKAEKASKAKKAKKQPTHVMPDGAIHTGKTHSKSSKVVKPAPKSKKAKKQPSAYNLFVKEFAKQNPNIGKNLMKEASKAYKASKDSGEILPAPPDEFFDKKNVSKLKRLEKKNMNEVLSDILDNFDIFNNEFENIFNTNMSAKEKKEEFDKILERVNNYSDRFFNDYEELFDTISWNRTQKAYGFVLETYEKYISKLKKLEKPKKVMKPCKTPQTRNPVTNRCKNMGAKPKKEPKPCKLPQVRNPDTGRCKKPKKEIKKRQPTAWDLHLKKVRAENPSVKGKQIMILAKQSYNKQPSAKSSTGKPQIKMVNFEEPKLNEIEDPFLQNPKNNNNDDLMDNIISSLNEYVNEMEQIANSDISKNEKQEMFNNILGETGVYIFQIEQQHGNSLSISERQEIKNGYKYIDQLFNDNFGLLQDGTPEQFFELEKYEELENIDKIILESLEGDNEPLYNQPLSYTDLIKYKEPSSLFKVPERTEAPDYTYYPAEDEYFDSDEDSIIDWIYDRDDNTLPLVTKADILNQPPITVDGEQYGFNADKKKKTPLGLRIYQEFLRLFKIQFPEASRAELNELWKNDKEYYKDLIMNMTEFSGGDITNEEHLFNVFRNVGGAMLSYNMSGGAMTFKKDGTYGNKYYKAKNPFGPPKKMVPPSKPSKPSPAFRKNSPVDRDEEDDDDLDIPVITSWLGMKKHYGERRLDSAEDWGDTIADIAKGTYTGVKNVLSLLSPLTWFV